VPEDAADWMQNYHLDYFGRFVREWVKYPSEMKDSSGEPLSFWNNTKTGESNWDSPYLVLEALINSQGQIESTQET
jgi:hypothetical protein